MKTASCHAFVLLLAGLSLARAQDGSNRTLATSATAAPGLGANFTVFSDPVLNGSGIVSFIGFTAGADAIFKTSGTGLTTIVSTLQSAPGLGANFDSFSVPVINESGTVAFSGFTTAATTGIYTGSGAALTTISTQGQAAPGLGGNISSFSTNIALSDTGGVAFTATATTATGTPSGEYLGSGGALTTLATTLQTAPGTGALFGSLMAPVFNNTGSAAFVEQNGTIYGLYTASGSTLTTVATTLQAAPEIGGTFYSFSFNPAINDSGGVAFSGSNGIGAGSQRGVFARIGGVLTAIASTTRLAPGLTGNFTNFLDPALSNSGIVAFRGAGSQAVTTEQGIYTGTGGALKTIAVTGQTAPGIGGNFSSFGKPAVNDIGIAAFLGNVAAGSGIYLGDGQQLVTVAFKGQSLGGSTVTSLTFGGGTDRGGSSQFNSNGQIAYKASLANGTSTVQLFTPTLHFRTPAGGAWATRSNWTLGLLPAAVHDIVLDPAAPLAITGPMLPTTIKSLAINGSGANVAQLTLQSTGTITAAGGASTGVSGRLSGSGKLIANLSSAGTIAPGLVSSAGSISVTGNVTLQSTAHLAFDLGGLARKTAYDFFGVTGLLTLGGSLDVSLLGGFAPQVGNSFDLFDATTLAGSFGSINLPSLTGGLTWNTALLPTTGVISVAGLSTLSTTYTLATAASAATIHAGGSSTITATITNTGAAGTDTLNYSGLNVAASPAGGTVTGITLALANSALPNGNTGQSGTATFSSAIGGTYTLTPTVASALNGTLGSAAASAGVSTTSVAVFSGSAKWTAPATASWGAGANANWTDTAAATVHAAPGTFAGFASADSAVFDATGGASTVNLDGASPSLAALSFTGGNHTLAQGTGGTLTLNNGASPATVTDSAGSHSITAPVQLASDLIATVTNAADTLTLSGSVTGAGKSLTKTGAGKLVLSGVQAYAALYLDGGTADITGSFTNGTAVVHANSATTFKASQTFASLIIGSGVEVTFGSGTAPGFGEALSKADTAAVPEPGAASLLLLSALGILSRRRRARL